jgi:hypothetical protein
VRDGQLEITPSAPYSGVRLLFTDLHLLGATTSKPEQYVGALITFIKKLIQPTTYLIVFWSKYPEEAKEAWEILSQRVPQELRPFAYEFLAKETAKLAADSDEDVAKPAREELIEAISGIFAKHSHLRALMAWESMVSTAAARTTNQFLNVLLTSGASIGTPLDARRVMVRMIQETMGLPHAASAQVSGLVQAFLPILQDELTEGDYQMVDRITDFTALAAGAKPVPLPAPKELTPILNDFFVHSEGDGTAPVDRGAIIQLDQTYLDGDAFYNDVGLMDEIGDWREAICREFYISWKKELVDRQAAAKALLNPENVYVVELSAVCDHAQNKPRSQRFLLATFVPSLVQNAKAFVGSDGRKQANEAIYSTPEITLKKQRGRLLVSCRIFLTRSFGVHVPGVCVSRLRKDVMDELSHHYATHMRRPGKIAFY